MSVWSSLSIWEFAEYGATATVFIGAAGEYTTEFLRFPRRAAKRKRFAKLSALVLMVGLALELLAVVRTTQLSRREIAELNNQAEQANDQAQQASDRAAQANKDAAQAQKDAGAATERAANAEADLAGAKERAALAEQHAAEAKKTAESFRLDIAKANERAALATQEAEQERLSRIQLEARLADRTLTTPQQTDMTNRLIPFRGATVDVAIWGDTTEILTISHLVMDSMTRAGWRVQWGQAFGGNAIVRGIVIGTRPGVDPQTARASAALLSALQAAGLVAVPWPYEDLQDPGNMMNSSYSGTANIKVFIGSKP